MRTLITIVALSGLGACASAAQPGPLPGPDGWIEVPLSDNTFREFPGGFRTDTIDIPLASRESLEYKLWIEEGGAIVYTWRVLEMARPELLTSEFHGHTEPEGDEPGTVMFYRIETGATESGALVAPFAGIHGWYFANVSEAPVVIRLMVAGFYELVPDQRASR